MSIPGKEEAQDFDALVNLSLECKGNCAELIHAKEERGS